MVVRLTYIFECKSGFKYVRETKDEILQIMQENYKALQEIANGEDDFCNMFLDAQKPIIRGSITCRVSGVWKFYDLRTEIEEIK